jgi:hypothetical protein
MIPKNITLITGDTQSGKTFTALEKAKETLMKKVFPIFIVKDNKQRIQLENRILNNIKNANIISKSKENKDKSKLKSKNKYKNIGVCIFHYTHIAYFNELMIDSKTPFALFIDEAHKLGGYKKLSQSGLGDDLHHESIKYEHELALLKEKALELYLITATPQDIIISEPFLTSDNIIKIPKSSEYKGIENWTFKTIPPKKSLTEEDYVDLAMFEPSISSLSVDKNFINIVHELSSVEPLKRTNKFGNQDLHPVNILAKFEIRNEYQRYLLECFKKDCVSCDEQHQEIIDAGWVVCTFNQKGIMLYHNSLEKGKISILNKDGAKVYYPENGVYTFPTAEIGQVWQWLYENGGVERFPRILTVAYKSAEEGITFSSTWTGEEDTDANWHLTHIFARLGESSPCAYIEQTMGRLSGNHGDDIKPVVYCTLKDKEKLLKSYALHVYEVEKCIQKGGKGEKEGEVEGGDEEVEGEIEGEKDEGNQGENQGEKDVNEPPKIFVADYVKDLEVLKNRFPKNYYAIGAKHIRSNIVSNPKAELEDLYVSLCEEFVDVMNLNLDEKELSKLMNSGAGSDVRANGNTNDSTLLTYLEVEFVKNKFKKWHSKDTKISRFMNSGIDPEKKYSIKEFGELCKEYSIESSHLFRNMYEGKTKGMKGNAKAYGKIFYKQGKNVHMYPQLVESFKAYF